jgi:hypothetical protein
VVAILISGWTTMRRIDGRAMPGCFYDGTPMSSSDSRGSGTERPPLPYPAIFQRNDQQDIGKALHLLRRHPALVIIVILW